MFLAINDERLMGGSMHDLQYKIVHRTVGIARTGQMALLEHKPKVEVHVDILWVFLSISGE